MTDTIRVNVSRMFELWEPWDVSNSVANLGPNAARHTWDNALSVAKSRRSWLRSPVKSTVEAVKEYAKALGAWDDSEIDSWDTDHALAFLVQEVASDMRENGFDDDVGSGDDADDDFASFARRVNAEPENGVTRYSYRSTGRGVMAEITLEG
jgi:hypothetical protein